MAEIAGYLREGLTAFPGDRVAVMVSTDAASFEAKLVRLIHGDTNPAGPGVKMDPVPSAIAGKSYPGRVQPVARGSFAVTHSPLSSDALHGLTIGAWAWPTRPERGSHQGLVSCWDEGSGRGVCLGLDADGYAELRVAVTAADTLRLCTNRRLRERTWYWLRASLDPEAGEARILAECEEWPRENSEGRCTIAPGQLRLPAVPLTLGARAAGNGADIPVGHGCFDGKLEAPFVLPWSASDAEHRDLAAGARPAEALAAWALEDGIDTNHIIDRGPNKLHGTVIQLPTRAVTGHLWTGHSDLREPTQYGAIHFHSDDLEDAAWSPDIEFSLPDDLKSGIYAVQLVVDGDLDHVPIVVPPADLAAANEVALLVPTFSYLAYANERMQDNPKLHEPGWLGLEIVPDRGDLALRRHPEYGASIYDSHADGTGICYSSWCRPILNIRPDHRNWQTHAPRHLASDLYFVDWLEREQIAFDCISDHLLHERGRVLLSEYKVVITGSHPEYWSEQMLDAVKAWLDDGGRLMYLGGNGFYWVTSVDPYRPHVVEVRRGIAGTRTWESIPGELRHSTTGEPGGLWRYRGRDPNRLVGIGFAAQGFDERAAGYERCAASYAGPAAWIFEGVEEPVIGEFGLVMEGAAGDEIDRFDPRHGSPPSTTVLATSRGRHTNFVQLVTEDIPVTHPNIGGQQNDDVRADITLMTTGTGGAVFAVGSMSWCGCLSHSAYNNNVARITRNVLDRFRNPIPIESPSESHETAAP